MDFGIALTFSNPGFKSDVQHLAKSQIDQAVLAEGLGYDHVWIAQHHGCEMRVRSMVEWIAPVSVYPGEHELQALAQGVLRALRQEEPVKQFGAGHNLLPHSEHYGAVFSTLRPVMP